MTVLALKVLLAPTFVVATSLISRRFGVVVAGVVAGLPAIAGPILLVLALDHGHSFARSAATGTLLGIVALVVFVLAFAWVCLRASWPWALAAGWGSFAAVIVALSPVHVGPVVAFTLACGACVGGLVLLPRGARASAEPQTYPRYDLALRAACAVVPVVSVTAAARLLGPHLSGLVAAFPVITPVLAAFTLAQSGPLEAVRLLRGMTLGFFAYALFCLTVSLGIHGLGIAAVFLLATLVALAAQTAAVAVSRQSAPAS
ncbi:MAG TPA: hypothetical protein VLK24_04215 [Gaiellaceae bacterium]|nr:hypothetical protein [Gaiellaceae bacterium]